jgi:DNA-binding NtrC family response regulator
MRTIAANAGMIVVGPSATVAEAEALLLSHTPDIAVVDLDLRGELAYSLIDRLHALGIPTIVASAYEMIPSMNNKVAASLPKPFNTQLLLIELSRIVQGRTMS